MPELAAIWLTLKLSLVTTLVLLMIGLPFAWWLSNKTGALRTVLETLTSLPLVMPPTVIGFYLLVIMSPDTFLGGLWLDLTGDISIAELIMNEVISLNSIKFRFDSDKFGSKLPMKILLSSENLKLGFDKDRCISSSGKINALVNDLELFGEVYETSVEANINCENNKLIANFITFPNTDLLSGDIVIDNELNYEIFGSSRMLEKVLEESLTGGVNINPSIEFQGNIHSLLR